MHAPVLDALNKAANLQRVGKQHHVSVLLSARYPEDKAEIESAGVRVISGKDFWEFGIPHLRAVAWALVGKEARQPGETELRSLNRWERPKPGQSYVADVSLADEVDWSDHAG